MSLGAKNFTVLTAFTGLTRIGRKCLQAKTWRRLFTILQQQTTESFALGLLMMSPNSRPPALISRCVSIINSGRETDFCSQILQNGKATINDGADGLQRLDQVVATANKFGVKLLLTLTNNWGPERTEPSSSFRRWNDRTLPRAYLSNDYGTCGHLPAGSPY